MSKRKHGAGENPNKITPYKKPHKRKDWLREKI